MKLVVEPFEDGKSVTIAAIDLTGDAWSDYLHYIDQARELESSGDLHGTNRALRSALGNLIAHLEGVVSGLHLKLQETRIDFKPFTRPDGRCTVKSQISHLRNHAKQHMHCPLPYLRLRLKPLRDILVHPSISKTAYDEGTGREIILSELDLFDLTFSELSREGRQISQWLDRLCAIYEYTRIHDTEKIIKDFVEKVGEFGMKLSGPGPKRL